MSKVVYDDDYLIEICYPDSDIFVSVGTIIHRKYPHLRSPKEFMDKCRKFMKNLTETYGELVSGDENLHITVDTSDSGLIYVNGTSYRVVR